MRESLGEGRIKELDGLRAVAILLVLIQHYVYSISGDAPLLAGMRPALATTWSGVDLFFVLSGFLIGGILIDNRRAPNVFGVFYLRRACRILPLYLVMVGLYLALNAGGLVFNDWLLKAQLPAWSYLTFTQNFFMVETSWFGAAWLGATWSLALEEQFYLVIPFVLVLAPRPVALILLVLGIVCAPFVRAYSDPLGAYILPLARADGLLLGVVIAFLVRSAIWRDHQSIWRRILLVALPALAAFYVWQAIRMPNGGDPYNHLVFALFYATLLLSALVWRRAAVTAVFRAPLMRWIGGRSYAIYLLHKPVIGTVQDLLFDNPIPGLATGQEVAATVLSFALTLALAELSFRCLEGPFLRLGGRFKFATPKQTAPVRAAASEAPS